MTVMRPCAFCPLKATCDERGQRRSAIKGMRLTVIDFRCATKLDLFPVGLRVELDVRDYSADDAYDNRHSATVLRWSTKNRHKLVVQLDDVAFTGDKEIRLLSVWPNRLTRADEPSRKVCLCGYATKADGSCDLPDKNERCSRVDIERGARLGYKASIRAFTLAGEPVPSPFSKDERFADQRRLEGYS